MLNPNRNNSRDRIDYRSPMNDTQQYLDRMRDARHVKQESFGSQKIDVNDYILSPEGWETFMFFIYFLAIPYLAGILFLFLFIAHANVTSFFTLDISTFFIVWAIGYETIAALLLLSIFFSYLNYLREPIHKHERR